MSGGRRINPIGVHTAIWDPRWDADGAAQVLARARAAGFDVVEILLIEPEQIDVPAVRRALTEQGLAAVGAFGLSPDADISSESPGTVRAGEKRLRAALEAGTRLGITHFCGVVYGALGSHDRAVTPGGRANSVQVVRGLCEEAERSGIAVALELVNRYESNLLNTTEQALRYIDDVGSGNLFIELDTYHMNIEEPGLHRAVLRCRDRLGYVQVGESHRGYLGSGNVRFGDFFQSLAAIGYSGPITFESFSTAAGGPELHNLLSIWREVWSDADDLARQAHMFIESGLRAAVQQQEGGA